MLKNMTNSPISTPLATIDSWLHRLSESKAAWNVTTLRQRLTYLQFCLETMPALAEKWVEQSCQSKGIDPHSSMAGEEWLSGPVFICRYLRLLIQALQTGGQPQPPKFYQRSPQQSVAKVLPQHWMEALIFWGFSAEVWMEPDQLPTQGRAYHQPSRECQLCLILGAGNLSSIAVLDCFYTLFVANSVIVLKLNPVVAYLSSLIESLMTPLIKAGFVAVVQGDADVGQYLCQHHLVETIHLTGSASTYERIVWGSPNDQSEQKLAGHPVLAKPITSELGCVTPVLVVPGSWSQDDLNYQARHIASMLGHNGSFNCNAVKVVVTSKQWPQRDQFLQLLRQELTQMPPRLAYYPGAWQRYQTFLDRYPQAEVLGSQDRPDAIPWTLITEVPIRPGEWALTTEAFCGVLAEVALDTGDPGDFLLKAVDVANQSIWGTLSCMLIIDPQTQKQYLDPFNQALEQLRYGAIGINCWSALAFGLMSTTWGAFPEPASSSMQSGSGTTHNAYLFDHPQKSIVVAPFRLPVTPPWFYTHRCLDRLGQAWLSFEVNPTVANMIKLLYFMLRG